MSPFKIYNSQHPHKLMTPVKIMEIEEDYSCIAE